jgi:hypothetical protein
MYLGIMCYNCQSTDHYAGDCPEIKGSTTSGFMLGTSQAMPLGIDPDSPAGLAVDDYLRLQKCSDAQQYLTQGTRAIT